MSTSGDLKTDSGDMAEELNNYFASVFTSESMPNLPQNGSSPGSDRDQLDDILITKEVYSYGQAHKTST